MLKLALQLRLQTKQDEEAKFLVILLIALNRIIVIHWGLIDKRELYISIMTIKIKWLLVNLIKTRRKAGRVLAILNRKQPAFWIRWQKWALSGKVLWFLYWMKQKLKPSALLITVNTSFGAQIVMKVHIWIKAWTLLNRDEKVKQKNIQTIYEGQCKANTLLICEKSKPGAGNTVIFTHMIITTTRPSSAQFWFYTLLHYTKLAVMHQINSHVSRIRCLKVSYAQKSLD